MAEIIQNNDEDMREVNERDYSNEVIGHEHKRLFYLHELDDYQVHEGDPDVRGWKVRLNSGEIIGTVENLIVDKAARRVRYLEVTTDRDFYNESDRDDYYLDRDLGRDYDANHDDHFLLPIGMVSLDRSDREVDVESTITTDTMVNVPRYRRGNAYLPTYERDTINYYVDNNYDFDGDYDPARYRDFDNNKYRSLDDEFYTTGFFADDKFYDRHEEARKGL